MTRVGAIQLALGALAVAVTVAFLVVVTGGEDDSAGPERGAPTLAELLSEPEAHLGAEVTVSGEVVRRDVAAGAFTIGAQVAAQENELFVLPRTDSGFDPGALREDSVVRVRGEVRRIEANGGDEGDLLFGDAEDDAFDEFEGELAIAASRVEVLPR